jgi:hypothetical protein
MIVLGEAHLQRTLDAYTDIIIGALLGHAKKGITGRYATAPDPALVSAADRISLALSNALDGTADHNVVQLPASVG